MFKHRIPTLVLGFVLFGAITLLAAPTKEQEEVVKYAKQLKAAKDAKAKIAALKELGRLGAIQVSLTKPVVPEIVKLLDDKEATVRGEAAHTLGKIEPDNKDEIVEKLAKMLKEEKDEPVRMNIAQGLADMGKDAKAAIPALREVMDKADKKQKKVYKEAINAINGK
jgi:HEAT repeat protein